MTVLSGTDAIMKKLEAIAKSIGGGEVSIGFMNGATYPDGTPVAAVAFWNEFGKPEIGQPPRPFFRNMIAENSDQWPADMAKAAKATEYDGQKTLSLMGEKIKGQLQKSINDFTTPAIKESTAHAKGFPKPLIDTGDMLRSVDYEVKS